LPKFKYRAVDNQGLLHTGILESNNYDAAMHELKERELWILDLFDLSKSLLYREISLGKPKVKVKHFTVFCRQLATLYKSGVSLVEAVRTLSAQTESKTLKKVLKGVSDDMAQGMQFSVACAAYPWIFNTIFVNMVRAGEASGTLDGMLDRLAVMFEKEYVTREKIKSAMVYPLIMGATTILVVTLLLVFVVPMYVDSFASMGLELPLITRIVVAVSHFVVQSWYLLPIFFFAPIITLNLLSKNPKGSYWLDLVKLKLPVFGTLAHKQSIARFCRTFSSLYAAAVPMLQIMDITANVVGNKVIGKVVRDSREELRSGQSIAKPFQDSWTFPPMVVHMLVVGEQTGALDSMMEKVADFYETDVDMMADRLKSLLEPLMILALSGIVGTIVLAVMLPSFKLMENIGQL
jgi:type IV pilus assembly protein PilC